MSGQAQDLKRSLGSDKGAKTMPPRCGLCCDRGSPWSRSLLPSLSASQGDVQRSFCEFA